MIDLRLLRGEVEADCLLSFVGLFLVREVFWCEVLWFSYLSLLLG